MAYRITIAPSTVGWTLHAPDLDHQPAFLSGARAEAAGRAMAERLARTGRDIELWIVLRNGDIAAAVRYPATRAA